MNAFKNRVFLLPSPRKDFFYVVPTNIDNKKRRAISPACLAYILYSGQTFFVPGGFIIRVTILSV